MNPFYISWLAMMVYIAGVLYLAVVGYRNPWYSIFGMIIAAPVFLWMLTFTYGLPVKCVLPDNGVQVLGYKISKPDVFLLLQDYDPSLPPYYCRMDYDEVVAEGLQQDKVDPVTGIEGTVVLRPKKQNAESGEATTADSVTSAPQYETDLIFPDFDLPPKN